MNILKRLLMRGQGGLLAAPVLLAAALLVLAPLLVTLALSFAEYNALSWPRFIGLDNWRQVLADPMFLLALKNSLSVLLMSLPVRLGLALLIGLLLAGNSRLARGGLLLVLLPVVLPETAWALAWLWILNPHFGPVAEWLNAWQPLGARWLLTADGARWSIVAVTSLLIGELVVIIAVARARLDPRLFAVCALEGGSRWHAFSRISLPLLWPLLVLLAARDAAISLQLSYAPALYVTKTGPQFATWFLPNEIYQSAFEYLRFGPAAAMTGVLIVFVLGLALIQALWLRDAIRR